MFLKKIDFEKIPFDRKLIYILALSLLPFFVCCIVQYSRWCELDAFSGRINDVFLLAKKKIEKEKSNKFVRSKYAKSDRFYLVKHVESYCPLQREKDSLQELLKGGFHSDAARYKRRLEALNSENFRISFAENAVRNYCGVKETVEVLAHPVEVDREDIKVLLNRIEGIDPKSDEVIEARPHLLFLEFSLNRTKNVFQEVYQLKMKLIKREYTKAYDKAS